MTRNKTLRCLVVFSGLACGLCAAQVPAATPAPSFTISATNVAMPLSGIVSIPFTLTSVNGFVGSVAVLCIEPTVAGSVHEGPYCDQGGPLMAYPLTANGTTTGSIMIVAIKPCAAFQQVEPRRTSRRCCAGTGRPGNARPWAAKKGVALVPACNAGNRHHDGAGWARTLRLRRPPYAHARNLHVYAQRDLRSDTRRYGKYHGERDGAGWGCDEVKQLA